MSEHTPETLTVLRDSTGRYVIHNRLGDVVAVCGRAQGDQRAEADARRIAAAWNATLDVPTEALEAGVVRELIDGYDLVIGLLLDLRTNRRLATQFPMLQDQLAVIARAIVPIVAKAKGKQP